MGSPLVVTRDPFRPRGVQGQRLVPEHISSWQVVDNVVSDRRASVIVAHRCSVGHWSEEFKGQEGRVGDMGVD